jgi:hypothetical protein
VQSVVKVLKAVPRIPRNQPRINPNSFGGAFNRQRFNPRLLQCNPWSRSLKAVPRIPRNQPRIKPSFFGGAFSKGSGLIRGSVSAVRGQSSCGCFSVELFSRRGLIRANMAGGDLGAMIVLAADRHTGKTPEHVDLAHVRQRVGNRTLK